MARNNQMTPKDIKQAMAMMRRVPAPSMAAVAALFGVKRQTIAYHCAKAGVKPRPVVVRPKSDA